MKHQLLENATAFGDWLRQNVQELGGLDAACLHPDPLLEDGLARRYHDWAEAGNRNRLTYLDDTLAYRIRPFSRRPGLRSLILITFTGNWGRCEQAPSLPLPAPGQPAGYISRYACGGDYHRLGRQIVEKLARRLELLTRQTFPYEIGIDTRPLPEVFLAATAGLGAIGRNCLLRTTAQGSRIFIGNLLLAMELPEVRREVEVTPACGDCGACVRDCPTGALGADGLVTLRLCRSYLSMEYRRPLNPEQQMLLGDALFGCDHCTAACPPPGPADRIAVDLEWLVTAPAAEIQRRISGTALERAGSTLLKRNAAAMLCRRGDRNAATVRDWILAHNHSPVVRETVMKSLAG